VKGDKMTFLLSTWAAQCTVNSRLGEETAGQTGENEHCAASLQVQGGKAP
jgi:hypothetical protein